MPIDPVTRGEALGRLQSFAAREGQHHVMTPNPEMLVAARRDPAFRDLLGRTALNLPDGAGLLWAARRGGQRLPERVTGVDLFTAFCLSGEVGSVFLLGAHDGIAEQAARHLKDKNPLLRIAGTFAGSPHQSDERAIVDRINASGARVLFVAYGAPAQDLWIDRNLKAMPGVRLAMGVGGAFDFVAGVRRRAPQWMRRVELEWLWRLLLQPKRIFRILTAVVVFPLLVLWAENDQ